MGAPEKLPRSGSRPFAPAEARSKIQTTPYQYRTTKQASKHDSIYTNDQGILQLQHATQELARILTCGLSLGSACRRSTCYGPGLQISGVKLRIGRSTRNGEEREEQNGRTGMIVTPFLTTFVTQAMFLVVGNQCFQHIISSWLLYLGCGVAAFLISVWLWILGLFRLSHASKGKFPTVTKCPLPVGVSQFFFL